MSNKPSTTKSTDAPAAAAAPGGFVARHGRTLIMVTAALLPLLVGGLMFLTRGSAPQPKGETVAPAVLYDDALEALEDGDYRRARKLAERLRRVAPTEFGGSASYILGTVAALEADEFLGSERIDLFLVAAGYLQEAAQAGFTEDQRAEGLYLLGKSLNFSQKYAESRGPLEAALEINRARESSLHWLLAIAYSKGESRDIPRALDHIKAHLADPTLEVADRHAALLEQLRMYYQAGDVAGCEAVLTKIPRESECYPDAQLIRGRLAMYRAGQVKEELQEEDRWSAEDVAKLRAAYEAAIAILRGAQDDPMGTTAIRRSMYLIGRCYLEMDDLPAALSQFERTRKVWLDTQEGLAAALEEADLLQRAGQSDDAMSAYLRVVGAAKAPFDNVWIPPDEFRGRVLSAYRQLIRDSQYEKAVQLADNLAPLFPQARAAEFAAEALLAWSSKLMAEAGKLPEVEAIATRQKARAMKRKAGRLFSDIANIEFSTRQYPDDLWRAAEAYLEGHDFRSAVNSIEEYLRHESRRRRPQALINMGECYLALNRLDEALEVCQECIEFYPTSAWSYQARILTSKAYSEKGELAQAEAMLRENLNGDFLDPDAIEWRESLFRLGDLLQAGGRYDEAVVRLREAVERYPDTPEAVRARYLIAESYRQLAKTIHEKLSKSDLNDTTRIAQQRELQNSLNSAIQYYKQVQESLNKRQERAKLTALERLILRNSFFAEGAAWFALGRYENAIRAYRTIVTRYEHDPEALEAFVQIASCYRRENKTMEARGTIQHAKLVLSRMDPDAPFVKVTNNSRREWVDLLDWLGTL